MFGFVECSSGWKVEALIEFSCPMEEVLRVLEVVFVEFIIFLILVSVVSMDTVF